MKMLSYLNQTPGFLRNAFYNTDDKICQNVKVSCNQTIYLEINMPIWGGVGDRIHAAIEEALF